MHKNNENAGYVAGAITYPRDIWVRCNDAEFLTPIPFKSFCQKQGALACLNFVRKFANIGQFFCDAGEFENAVSDKHITVMRGKGKEIRIVPFGYQSFDDLLNIDDLKNAGIL